MFGMFWELRQSRGISDAQTTAARGTARANVAAEQVKALESRIDKLMLVCMAMWSVIQEKTGLTDEELLRKVKEIDLADGVADGKVTRTVAKCPQCGQVMSPRHGRCLYCGGQKLNVTAFDQIM